MAVLTLPTGLTYQFIDPLFTQEQLQPLNDALLLALSAGPDRSPLQRWLGFMFGNCRISKQGAIDLLPLTPGDPSPFFETLDNLTQEGYIIKRGKTHVEPAMINAELPVWLTPSERLLLWLSGGEIENEEIYFELNDLEQEVPASFPNRLLIDGVTIHTWATWGTDGYNHIPRLIDGKYYRSSLIGAAGVPLKASEWCPYLLSGGIIKTKYEYQQILESISE